MKRSFLLSLMVSILLCAPIFSLNGQETDWELVFCDEFDSPDIDWTTWHAEKGFVRNEEYQWYQAQNAYTEGGILILEGRLDSISNPHYRPESRNWRQSRPWAQYSSASINTRGTFSFLYGRLEVRARIPAVLGAWPAIWTLGSDMEWPSCGEIDVMEYYHINGQPHILANAAWGNNRRYNAVWNTQRIPYQHFLEKDPYWGEKFHTWVMGWNEQWLRIYLDGELLNEVNLEETYNGAIGQNKNPMRQPHYILLNLAIGGINGGEPQHDAFPMRYEVDYVRVYKQRTNP